MTILEAIDYANRHSCLELYELGVKDGKHEAILQQANHDQAVKQAYDQGWYDRGNNLEPMIREIHDKVWQQAVNMTVDKVIALIKPCMLQETNSDCAMCSENLIADIEKAKEQK